MTAAAFGVPAALLAALAYGAASVLQALGVRRFNDAHGRPWQRLWAGRLYGAGLLLDAAGFAASLVALRTVPLFVVESAIASSVAVTALLAALMLRVRLRRPEKLALAVIGLGLLLLAVSAGEGPATRPHLVGPLLLATTALVAGMTLLGWSRPRGSRLGLALLSGAAGLGFSAAAVAARVIDVPHPWWHAAGSLLGVAMVAHGALALTAYTIALERGRVTTVAAVTFAVETVVPAAIGLTWLGDAVRPGPGWVVVATLGFVLTLGASMALASYAEPTAEVSHEPVVGAEP